MDNRLQDVVHSEKRIYLVFEYLDLDLKKHMDSSPEFAKDSRLIKVRPFSLYKYTSGVDLFYRHDCVTFWWLSNGSINFLESFSCMVLLLSFQELSQQGLHGRVLD